MNRLRLTILFLLSLTLCKAQSDGIHLHGVYFNVGLGASSFYNHSETSSDLQWSAIMGCGKYGTFKDSKFGYRASMQLITKGAKHLKTPLNDHVTQIRTYFLEVPFNLNYTFPVSHKYAIEIGAGPFLAVGLNGTIRSDGGEMFKTKISTYGPFEGMRRFDAGINTVVYFHFHNQFVGLYYDRGFIPFCKYNDMTFPRNKQWMLTWGIHINRIP